jgi:hypothetical protein
MKNKIDPYTRAAIGMIFGFALALSLTITIRYFGIGIMIAGALQLVQVHKGGRLIKNLSSIPVFILDEKYSMTQLSAGQIPSNAIVGFTFQGLNGVFKLTDGVYIKIKSNGSITYTPGVGKIINQIIRSGGLKSKEWAAIQRDKRWQELFNNSI